MVLRRRRSGRDPALRTTLMSSLNQNGSVSTSIAFSGGKLKVLMLWVVDPLESPDIDQVVVFNNETWPDFFCIRPFDVS